MLTLSYAASRTLADDIEDNDFDANKWIFKCDEHHMLDDFAVPGATLEILEEQKHDQSCQLILISDVKASTSGFHEPENVLLCLQLPSIHGLQ